MKMLSFFQFKRPRTSDALEDDGQDGGHDDNHETIDHTTCTTGTRNRRSKYSHEISKLGVNFRWRIGRHYDASHLEQYRLVGDVELDQLLEVGSGNNNATSAYRSSSSYGSRSKELELDHKEGKEEEEREKRMEVMIPKLDGRFTNTISICREMYHRHHDANAKTDDIQDESDSERLCREFYRHYHDHVPSWVNWDQIQRGIDVFITYSPVAGQGLYYYSLVPGFSIPKIAKVLERTRYLAPPSTAEQVMHRLMDTGGFLNTIMLPDEISDENEKGVANTKHSRTFKSAGPLRPGGKAWTMALQVRTLHAKVRRSILKQAHSRAQKQRHQQWDIHEYGIPINQEDMAATLLAFSDNVLAAIEFIAGRPLPIHDQLDYLALWRYVGWLLGVETPEDENHDSLSSLEKNSMTSTSTSTSCTRSRSDLDSLDPCGTRVASGHGHDRATAHEDGPIIHARALLESIVVHLMHPNDTSRQIAHHLLRVGNERSHGEAPFRLLYRSYMCRRYIGEELADALKISKPPSANIPITCKRDVKESCIWFLTWIILMIARIYTLLTMKSTKFRAWAYARHLRLMRKFDRVWSDKHGKRMQKAAQDAMMGHHKDKDMNNKASHDPNHLDLAPSSLAAPSCPFALIMPPMEEDENDSCEKKNKKD